MTENESAAQLVLKEAESKTKEFLKERKILKLDTCYKSKHFALVPYLTNSYQVLITVNLRQEP